METARAVQGKNLMVARKRSRLGDSDQEKNVHQLQRLYKTARAVHWQVKKLMHLMVVAPEARKRKKG